MANVYNRWGVRRKRIFYLAGGGRLVIAYDVGYYLACIFFPGDAPVKWKLLRCRNTALEAVRAAIAAYRADIPQNQRIRHDLEFC